MTFPPEPSQRERSGEYFSRLSAVGLRGIPVDRGLAGILLICLVASTIFTFLFMGLKPDEALTLIRQEAFGGGLEKVQTYSIELLTRKPAKALEFRFYYLVRVDRSTHEALMTVFESSGINRPSEDALMSAPKVKSMLALMESFPTRPGHEYFQDEAVYEDRFHRSRYDLGVLDLHSFLRHLPSDAAPAAYGCHLVFAALFHEGNISFYEGVRDFYLDRSRSIGEISYGTGDESYLFENRVVTVPRAVQYVDVAQAPPFGTIRFEDVGAKETVRVLFTTRHLAGPGMLITRVVLDGKVEKTYYRFVGWPEQAY